MDNQDITESKDIGNYTGNDSKEEIVNKLNRILVYLESQHDYTHNVLAYLQILKIRRKYFEDRYSQGA